MENGEKEKEKEKVETDEAEKPHDVCRYCGFDHGTEGRPGWDCIWCGCN